MLYRSRSLLLTVLLLAGGLAAFGQQVIRSLRCTSSSGRLQLCRVNPRGGVRLVRQVSGPPCIENRTWGVSREGIWVDRGCSADFVVGRGGSGIGPSPGPLPLRPVMRTIRCSSENGRRTTCQADVRNGIRLVKQISGPPCIRDKTWGIQPGGIWVDRGCRADFIAGR